MILSWMSNDWRDIGDTMDLEGSRGFNEVSGDYGDYHVIWRGTGTGKIFTGKFRGIKKFFAAFGARNFHFFAPQAKILRIFEVLKPDFFYFCAAAEK